VAVNASKRRRGLIAVVAAVIAAGAFFFALNLQNSSNGGNGAPPVAQATPAPTVAVVVVSAEIKPGDLLASTNVSVQQRTLSTLPATVAGVPGFYTDTVALLSTPHYASIALPSGTVLQASMLASSPAAAKPVLSTVIEITKGDLALSIPYTADRGVAGYIQPGDHIDILLWVNDPQNVKDPGVLYFAFQDVHVLRVGGPADALVANSVAANLVIELPRQQAGALSFLMEHTVASHFRIVLRPRDAFGTGKQPGSGQVNGTNWPTFLDG
jgi:Flp pilus assembly protein CpaB